MRKEMHSTHVSGLKDTHSVFLVSNTECKHNFVYKKAPQGTFKQTG